MANRDEENIELESQPLNAEKKAEILTSTKNDQKEKKTPIGLTKEELMKYAKDPFWCKLRKTLFALFWVLWLSMFVGAFLIIHFVPNCPATSRLKWYQRESTNQVNLELFENKLSNITKNIETFNKIFKTQTFLLPNILNSTSTNDISNHFELNTTIGSHEDLSKMLKELRTSYETNVIMDFNAATTSRDHPWFKAFKEGKDKYANYYLVADSEYQSYINYEIEEIAGRSLITKNSRPLLNLLNPNVRTEFKTFFDKWTRLNIKGFRILGAPFLLENQETKRVTKSVELNQKLIKEWAKELKYAVSDGVLMLQLDDQDAEDYTKYFGTQEDPIADIVINKFVSRLNARNSTHDISTQLQGIINSTKVWNDELNNIGPWTGWLVDDLEEKEEYKDDLVVCFRNILGYTLPRGMPITRISFNLLHVGLPRLFFYELEHNFNNIEMGTFDNVRLFAKLSNLRRDYADVIMLGKTEFVNSSPNDVFAMIRSNDKQGLIVIANLNNNEPRKVKLNIDFTRYPKTAQVVASCKIKEGHLMGNKINLDEQINLNLNETLIAVFDII